MSEPAAGEPRPEHPTMTADAAARGGATPTLTPDPPGPAPPDDQPGPANAAPGAPAGVGELVAPAAAGAEPMVPAVDPEPRVPPIAAAPQVPAPSAAPPRPSVPGGLDEDAALATEHAFAEVLAAVHDGWRAVCERVLGTAAHADLRIGRHEAPAPADCGFTRHRGLRYGQDADWRLTLPDGRGIHVREYKDRYDVHWDRVCPLQKPVRHLAFDTPGLFAAGTAATVATAFLAVNFGVGWWRRRRT